MRIIAPSSSDALQPWDLKIQALQAEVAQLKLAVAALRASPVAPLVSPPNVRPVTPAAPFTSRAAEDPLFAQLWAYVNSQR